MGFSVVERVRSFRYAFRGIALVFSSQHNSWIHATAAISVIGLGLYESLSPVEWCIIVIAIGLVLVTETLNTAIEFLADEISLERREGLGRAKDVGAGAVLLASFCSVVLGLFVFVLISSGKEFAPFTFLMTHGNRLGL